MNLISDKMRYYTNIILSGALASMPLIYYYYQLGKRGDEFFIFSSGISILFVGRICLEFALYIENNYIDTRVTCEVNKPNHYENFPEPGNRFNENWYGYLSIDGGKVAKEIISHLADRLLFFLSTAVAAVFGCLSILVVFPLETYASIAIISGATVYFICAYRHCIWLSTGLDYIRHLLNTNQPAA